MFQLLHVAMHAGHLVSVQWVHFDLTLVWAHIVGALWGYTFSSLWPHHEYPVRSWWHHCEIKLLSWWQRSVTAGAATYGDILLQYQWHGHNASARQEGWVTVTLQRYNGQTALFQALTIGQMRSEDLDNLNILFITLSIMSTNSFSHKHGGMI